LAQTEVNSQKLAPGTALPPERQLADLLDVSRPSLREALHILQAQGLVAIKHGQGTFVSEPVLAQDLRAATIAKTHDLNELFDAREALEVPSSRWASERANKEDIRTLRATKFTIITLQVWLLVCLCFHHLHFNFIDQAFSLSTKAFTFSIFFKPAATSNLLLISTAKRSLATDSFSNSFNKSTSLSCGFNANNLLIA